MYYNIGLKAAFCSTIKRKSPTWHKNSPTTRAVFIFENILENFNYYFATILWPVHNGAVVYIVRCRLCQVGEVGANPASSTRAQKKKKKMIFINEWLPNPIGADAKGEFVELFNNGDTPLNLSGWSLNTGAKKRFKLSGVIRAQGYLLLPRSETKLALKNTDGNIFLYDAAGELVDKSTFVGTATEGKSFNRISYNAYDASSVYATIQQFVWGKPTPGAKNDAVPGAGISEIQYPTNVSLNVAGSGWFSVFGSAVFAGVIFAIILWYAMKHDESISQLFFRGDQAIR